jgi:hypothetical protein
MNAGNGIVKYVDQHNNYKQALELAKKEVAGAGNKCDKSLVDVLRLILVQQEQLIAHGILLQQQVTTLEGKLNQSEKTKQTDREANLKNTQELNNRISQLSYQVYAADTRATETSKALNELQDKYNVLLNRPPVIVYKREIIGWSRD